MVLGEDESMQPTMDREVTPPAPRPLDTGGAADGGVRDGAPAGAGPGASARAPRARLSIAGRPEPRPATTPWRRTWQWVVAAGVTVLLAWLTYSREGWIPILSAFDLGVHEFGHLLTMWAPALLCSLAGSLLQVAAPLLLGGYFWWRRDSLAAILMIAWSAENLHNVSVYVADAQVMVLPLFGDDGSGAGHDWHNILLALNALEATDQLALVVRTASVILFVVALGLVALGFSRARRT
jgi:hypothetical protein